MMHIAFCTDTNYVMPCGVAMTSICENNRNEDIDFHLVITDEGKSFNEVETKVKPLRYIAEKYGKFVYVYKISAERIKDFICTGEPGITTTAFARIFLPEILPNNIAKVLYLDCDLVCEGSLRELWEIQLDAECPIGAVVDSNYVSATLHLQAEIPQEVNYVNSGVLLMNLDCWRRNNYQDLAINTAIDKKFPLLDQDLINHIFCGKIHYLPVKYNVQLVLLLKGVEECHINLDYYNEMKEAINNPLIIHYLTSHKPWKEEICPKREVWNKYLQKTQWRNLQLEPLVTGFYRTNIFLDIQDTFWMDSNLFKKEIKSYLRFFQSAIKLKNKAKFLSVISLMLNVSAYILEKIYNFKIKRVK